MRSCSLKNILEILQNSNLRASGDAVSEFNILQVEISADSISCKELLITYQMRSTHLSQYTTVHAKQLKASTEELCNNLRNHKEKQCLLHTLKGSAKHQYILVVLQNTQTLLGCLKTIGKSSVSALEWAELWGVKP